MLGQRTYRQKVVLDVLGPGGGLILADGYNVCPGTPIEHLAVLREVAREYGAPPGWGHPQ